MSPEPINWHVICKHRPHHKNDNHLIKSQLQRHKTKKIISLSIPEGDNYGVGPKFEEMLLQKY